MIYNGIALMISSGLGLYGVLYQLHHMAIEGYHELLRDEPLTAPRGYIERRHMRRECVECSMICEMATTIRADAVR